MRNRKRIAWLPVLLLAGALPAQANVIGIAVDDNITPTPVGSTNGDGSINFYALLNGTGTYGVAGAGLSPDTCTKTSSYSTCTGGTLDMWLRFSPVTIGANTLTLQFSDLDLFGVHDPSYFLESVQIYDSSLTSLALVDSLYDPEVVLGATNADTQTLSLLLDVTSNPYFTRLTFRTRFVGAPRGSYINTRESVLATISPVSVPEPTTLTLLGGGLLLIGFASRRRRV
ncbi:MAG TPA: PEP-CTERM sorting domain-containing protein [Gammaproteobacteria bacterium]